MRTWSWTHDFESYLYWWPITGTSIIRDAGKEKNKAIKGKSGRGRVTNLILTKLKGYSTQKQQNYESNFDCNLIALSHRGLSNPMIHREGWNELNTGSNDDQKKFYISFIYKGKKAYGRSCRCAVTFSVLHFPVRVRQTGVGWWWSAREPQ